VRKYRRGSPKEVVENKLKTLALCLLLLASGMLGCGKKTPTQTAQPFVPTMQIAQEKADNCWMNCVGHLNSPGSRAACIAGAINWRAMNENMTRDFFPHELDVRLHDNGIHVTRFNFHGRKAGEGRIWGADTGSDTGSGGLRMID